MDFPLHLLKHALRPLGILFGSIVGLFWLLAYNMTIVVRHGFFPLEEGERQYGEASISCVWQGQCIPLSVTWHWLFGTGLAGVMLEISLLATLYLCWTMGVEPMLSAWYKGVCATYKAPTTRPMRR